MNILVTGGAGFIGANFILYWIRNHPNDHITNYDLLTYAGNLENLQSIQNAENYHFIKGDIRDSDSLAQALSGIDIVVHFAAESHVDRSIMDPSRFIMTNIVGTYVLLEESRKAKIKHFHHVSTDEVFGSLSLDSVIRFHETTLYDPRSPYSASKASSDHVVRAYFHTYGLPVTISNCSNNFGPYQFPEKLIPLVITNILEGKKVPVYGDGENIRDWLYVEDHCRAIESIILQGNIGETYCVGGLTEDIHNLDVVKKIITLLGKDHNVIEYVKDRPGHDRRYAIDWSKIKNELGWSPLHDFDFWLQKTVNWYTTNESWWKKIKSGQYMDYYQKQYGDTS